MPLPAAAIPLIAGAFGLGSNLLSNYGRSKRESNKRFYDMQMEHSRRQYDQQMWDKVNKYNHPLEQMSRLTQAGLNPNLIYGSSPGSAVGNAQSIGQGKQLTGQAPQYQIDNPMTPFMDTKVKQAQSNNLNTAAMKNIAGANLSDSQTNKINSLLASEVTMAEEGAKKSKIETFLKDLEKTGKAKHYLANMAAETQKAVQEASISEARKHIMQLDATLAKQGIRPGDKQWISLFVRIFDLDINNMINPRTEILEKLQYYKIPKF